MLSVQIDVCFSKGCRYPITGFLIDKNKVFAGQDSTEIRPDADDIEGFKAFRENYKKGLAAEKAAVDAF